MNYIGQWSTFYVLTGTSAASLIGLMFVVITLIIGSERARRADDAFAAFSTPTVVHFAAALLMSAVIIAPWRQVTIPAILLGLFGIAGVLYIVRLALIARRLDGYSADAEDWSWYTALPLIAYAALIYGAVIFRGATSTALFVFGGSALLLIFIGIHNAWDIVTFLTIGRDQPAAADAQRPVKPG